MSLGEQLLLQLLSHLSKEDAIWLIETDESLVMFVEDNIPLPDWITHFAKNSAKKHEDKVMATDLTRILEWAETKAPELHSAVTTHPRGVEWLARQAEDVKDWLLK